MPAAPTEIAKNPIRLDRFLDAFSSDGRKADSSKLLEQLGVKKISELAGALRLINGGVQTAPKGVIQDPAGSAITSGGLPKESGAKGASEAIYKQFPDLQAVPRIKQRSAIFNGSTGPGHRVLHTYSPELAGSPQSSQDRQKAVEDLANAYANALVAFRDAAAGLGADGTLLNLVPVSANIYAGEFKASPYGHLHPSYTICTIALALNWSRGSDSGLPSLTLYYYDKPVYQDATQVMNALAGV